MKQAKILLDGKVQGVGLRESIKKRADELGLVGQARNLADGGVGVVCEGHQDSIDELVGKLRGSPGLATVDNASVSYSESEGEYESFVVVRDDEKTEMLKVINAGVDQLKIMNGKLGNIEEGVNGIKEGVNGIKEGVNGISDKLDVMNETNKEGFRRTQEEIRGVGDKLDVMNETTQEGFRRTQEEIRGVGDKLDVMNETTQEGFRRVRA